MADITPKDRVKHNPYWSEITEKDLEEYDVLEDEGGVITFFNSRGRAHRSGNKPAEVDLGRDTNYYVNGKLHRTDGPARDWKEITGYCLEGTLYTYKDWLEKRKPYLIMEKLQKELEEVYV